MVETPRVHGVLITFRRPDELTDHLRILAAQTAPLTSLLVVDNDDDDRIRRISTDPTGPAAGAADHLLYQGIPGNPGPAGGIAAGIEHVLARADDDDWLVLLDDDDPPPRRHTLEAIQNVLAGLRVERADVAGVGLWGATLRRHGRLRAATASEPEPVAYIPGGACPHYSVGTLRRSGGPDPALFFGFDDLDLGLAIQRVGGTLWSSGLAREHGWSAMVDHRTASAAVERPSWRRYYSLRNLVIVLRRDRRLAAAIAMSIIAGLGKPLANLPFRPRASWAALRLNATALTHGWRGRSGKTLDPCDLPKRLR